MSVDAVEIVGTASEAHALPIPPLLVLEPVRELLDRHGIGSGPVRARRVGEGQSNVTYVIERHDARVVLRRGPRPPFPVSAHDMAREARIQIALREQGFPVPHVLVVCEDDAVIGTPFYVMEFLNGTVITDRAPAPFDTLPARRRLSEELIDALVRLHAVDISRDPVRDLGRPDGYLERQVRRFASLWPLNTTREIREVEVVSDWLERNLPPSQSASVVHGDYRMGNLMFAGDPVRALAVLDWEMATLGDPLADLGYLTALYAEPGSEPTVMELTPLTREQGFLTRDGLIERYVAQTGLDAGGLAWYQCLALWKSAVFCEAIYTRWLRGERPDDRSFGPQLELGVPVLLDQAMDIAGI